MRPISVFLNFDYVHRRTVDFADRIYVRATWIARGSGCVMYKSKVCGAVRGDDARAEAERLARAWLTKQNASAPSYVDTTSR